MKQLTFTTGIGTVATVRRAGLIGKVQAYIEANPWQECGDIANALDESPVRVSQRLNALKIEGNAEQIKSAGRSNKSLWAGTSEAGRERRETLRVDVELAHNENVQAKTIKRFQDRLRRSAKDVANDARGIGLAKLFANERMEA